MSKLNERITFECEFGIIEPRTVNTFIDGHPCIVSLFVSDGGLAVEVRFKDKSIFVSDTIKLDLKDFYYGILDLESNTFEAFSVTRSLGVVYLGEVGISRMRELEKKSKRVVNVAALTYILLLFLVISALIFLNG